MTLRLWVRAARATCVTALILAVSCNSPTTASEQSPNATEAAPPDVSPLPSGVPVPRTTPPGTPGPTPDQATAESVEVDRAQIDKVVPKTPEPTASPQPGLWRIDGYVVDESGAPLSGVCVVIGPRGCQRFSPHTDDRGYWFIDIAEGHTLFDFYFEMPGKKTVWWRTIPEGPTEFNVKLVDG